MAMPTTPQVMVVLLVCHSELSLQPFCILYVWCLFWCLLSTFRFQVGCLIPLWAQLLGFAPLQPHGVYPWQAYVQPGYGHQSTPGMHRVTAPSSTFSRWGTSAIQSAVPQPSHLYGGAYSLGGLTVSHPIPLSS